MKVTKYVYVSFSEYGEDNISYSLFDNRLHETIAHDSNYKFIEEIEVEALSRDEVVALGVKEFDEKLFKLRMQIEAVENRKREMLALPMPEGE